MKELAKSIVAIVMGIILLVVETDLSLLLFGVIPISLKVIGAIFLIVGVIMAIITLVNKRK